MSHAAATPVTEGHRRDLEDLDLRATAEIVEALCESQRSVPDAVSEAAGAIAVAVDVVVHALAQGGRLIYAGAGSAGRIAALDAAECRPTFGSEPGQVVSLLAGATLPPGDEQEAAEDDEAAGRADVQALAPTVHDVVVAVSASGSTPYALGAVAAARAAGACSVAVACNTGSPLAQLADHAIEVVVGAEPITGSSRLKAGTAQKLVLNALSTAVMVRLGRTYGNLMVDMRATNAKLRERAARLVALATGAPLDEAAAALAASDGETRTAIAALALGQAPADARRALAAAGGDLRRALGTRS